jgi:hypothetical protein
MPFGIIDPRHHIQHSFHDFVLKLLSLMNFIRLSTEITGSTINSMLSWIVGISGDTFCLYFIKSIELFLIWVFDQHLFIVITGNIYYFVICSNPKSLPSFFKILEYFFNCYSQIQLSMFLIDVFPTIFEIISRQALQRFIW